MSTFCGEWWRLWIDRFLRNFLRICPGLAGAALKFFLIPFFVVHYGMFCFGHLTAVVGIFGGGGISLRAGSALAELWQPSFWIAVVAVFASHLYSFFANFIGEGEYKRANLMLLMHRPYGADRCHAYRDRGGCGTGDVARQSITDAVDPDSYKNVPGYSHARERTWQVVCNPSDAGLILTPPTTPLFENCEWRH